MSVVETLTWLWGFRNNSLYMLDFTEAFSDPDHKAIYSSKLRCFPCMDYFPQETTLRPNLSYVRIQGKSWQAVKGKGFIHCNLPVQLSNYKLQITRAEKGNSSQMQWNVLIVWNRVWFVLWGFFEHSTKKGIKCCLSLRMLPTCQMVSKEQSLNIPSKFIFGGGRGRESGSKLPPVC